jgi:FAD/FMN-containing dehydrogenase
MQFTRRTFSASLLAAPALVGRAQAALPPFPNIAPDDATFVLPGTALYQSTLSAYNLRTELKPVLRILTKTPRGLAQAVDWVRQRNLPFALRSGGHSYEGFSQSAGVVIDTRLMNAVALEAQSGLLSVGAGATLGDIYKFAGARGFAFPGGSCPTVGISGHVLGGGFGLLGRSRGLACDSLVGIDLVDADGRPVRVDADRNTDLFWACRGGGGGNFGAAARLQFRIAPIGTVTVFSMTWALPLTKATALFRAWQDWAPDAPDAITGIFRVSMRRDGKIVLHIAGQTTGSGAEVQRELRGLMDLAEPAEALRLQPMSFLGAVNHFSGGWSYESGYSKSKSDFITRPLDGAGIDAFLGGIAALPPGEVIAICDAYGGALDRIDPAATAFAYRAGTQYCIQYYTSWASPAAGVRRLADIQRFYGSMRPWSGGAYVNYPDLDLADWRRAYWRQNLERLRAVKARFDPGNVFHHAQSVG